LVFASEMDGWMRLYSIPASGGEVMALTPTGCEWEQMTFTPEKRDIVFSSNCNDIDRRHLWRVSVNDGKAVPISSGVSNDGKVTPSSSGVSNEWNPVLTGNGARLAFLKSSAQEPAMLYVTGAPGRLQDFRLVARTTWPITAETLPKDFPTSKLVAPQQVIFKAADGLEIHG